MHSPLSLPKYTERVAVIVYSPFVIDDAPPLNYALVLQAKAVTVLVVAWHPSVLFNSLLLRSLYTLAETLTATSMPIDHYENFPVASVLLPKRLRIPVQHIYRFARCADDVADEGDHSDDWRLQELDRYAQQLDLINEQRIEQDGQQRDRKSTRLNSS